MHSATLDVAACCFSPLTVICDFLTKGKEAVGNEEVRQTFKRSEPNARNSETIGFEATKTETTAKFSVKFEYFRLHSETTFAFLRSWPLFAVLFRLKQNYFAKKTPLIL